jgi:uncharacterized protein YbaP (TraB family)
MLRGIVAVVATAFLAGCSTHRLAEKTQMPLHPIHETRMTNQPTPGYVPTGVWRVRGQANTVYLVGTCHVVSDDEIPFPSAYYAAYRDAKELFVEVDPLSFSGTWMLLTALPGAARFFVKHHSEFTCPKGRTLEDYISADTVHQLREHYGEEYAAKKRFTPVGLIFLNEFGGGGDGEGGVDDLFALLAHRDGKRIRSLDKKAAAQLVVPTLDAILNQARREIAVRGADAVLKEATLTDEEERDDWRYGDVSAAAHEIAELKRHEPVLYDQLLPGRNRQWFATITRALARKHNVMILVGALHLAGEDGLIDMLRRERFNPEQMYGIDRPARAAVSAAVR